MSKTNVIFGILLLIITVMITVLACSFLPAEPTDAEGHEDVEFSWGDGSGGHNMTVSVPIADIEGYQRTLIPRQFCIFAAERYITDDHAVREVSSKLYDMTNGMNNIERVFFVNYFVHKNIEYRSDPDMHNCRDYYQYPAETILSKQGDCEDMAILEIAILRNMGYDAILLTNGSHAIAGVAGIECSGDYTDYSGKSYYHLDPTMNTGIGVSADGGYFPMKNLFGEIFLVILIISWIVCLMSISGVLFGSNNDKVYRKRTE